MSKNKQLCDDFRYAVIPRTLIFVFNKESILLIKGSQNKKTWSGLLNGIGGHVEKGEDILASAYRELEEETGRNDVSLKLCGIVMIEHKENTGIGVFIFRGETDNKNVRCSDEGDLFWLNFTELADQPVVEDLSLLLSKVTSYKSEGTPFFGLYKKDKNGKLLVTFNSDSHKKY